MWNLTEEEENLWNLQSLLKDEEQLRQKVWSWRKTVPRGALKISKIPTWFHTQARAYYTHDRLSLFPLWKHLSHQNNKLLHTTFTGILFLLLPLSHILQQHFTLQLETLQRLSSNESRQFLKIKGLKLLAIRRASYELHASHSENGDEFHSQSIHSEHASHWLTDPLESGASRLTSHYHRLQLNWTDQLTDPCCRSQSNVGCQWKDVLSACTFTAGCPWTSQRGTEFSFKSKSPGFSRHIEDVFFVILFLFVWGKLKIQKSWCWCFQGSF